MPEPILTFRPIDLDRHADLCVAFRADSYVCGDGDARRFWATAGPDGKAYFGRLATHLDDLPGSCVHVWLDERVVGQVEMMRDPDDPSAGKVNLFYLEPDHRGIGLGRQLEAYALAYLRDQGFARAWLRVSRTNRRAVAFYAKQAWVNSGPDARNPHMDVLRKTLSSGYA